MHLKKRIATFKTGIKKNLQGTKNGPLRTTTDYGQKVTLLIFLIKIKHEIICKFLAENKYGST
jgi:hypothetical protein